MGMFLDVTRGHGVSTGWGKGKGEGGKRGKHKTFLQDGHLERAKSPVL